MFEMIAGAAVTVLSQVVKKKASEEVKLPFNGVIPKKWMPVATIILAIGAIFIGDVATAENLLGAINTAGSTAGWSMLLYSLAEQIKKARV